MDKFEFLIGTWNLEYRVPKSRLSEAATGAGTGTFQRILDNKYVTFDYKGKLTIGEAGAHGIFGWDEKINAYRYWWFESSGAFMEATCNLLNENTLFMNWHNSLLKQTFTKINKDEVILKMEQPVSENEYELILEVVFRVAN